MAQKAREETKNHCPGYCYSIAVLTTICSLSTQSQREKVAVERFAPEAAAEETEAKAPSGSGTPLGEIDYINEVAKLGNLSCSAKRGARFRTLPKLSANISREFAPLPSSRAPSPLARNPSCSLSLFVGR